jgi:hypothetical protein
MELCDRVKGMLKEPRRVVERCSGKCCRCRVGQCRRRLHAVFKYHKIVYSQGVYVCYTTLMLIVDYSLMEMKLFVVVCSEGRDVKLQRRCNMMRRKL